MSALTKIYMYIKATPHPPRNLNRGHTSFLKVMSLKEKLSGHYIKPSSIWQTPWVYYGVYQNSAQSKMSDL